MTRRTDCQDSFVYALERESLAMLPDQWAFTYSGSALMSGVPGSVAGRTGRLLRFQKWDNNISDNLARLSARWKGQRIRSDAYSIASKVEIRASQ